MGMRERTAASSWSIRNWSLTLVVKGPADSSRRVTLLLYSVDDCVGSRDGRSVKPMQVTPCARSRGRARGLASVGRTGLQGGVMTSAARRGGRQARIACAAELELVRLSTSCSTARSPPRSSGAGEGCCARSTVANSRPPRSTQRASRQRGKGNLTLVP